MLNDAQRAEIITSAIAWLGWEKADALAWIEKIESLGSNPKASDAERQEFIDDAAKRNLAAATAGFMASDDYGEWDAAGQAAGSYDDAEALWNEREKRRAGGK